MTSPPDEVSTLRHCCGHRLKAQLTAESSSWFARWFLAHDPKHSGLKGAPRHARSHVPSSTHADEPRHAFTCFPHLSSAQAKHPSTPPASGAPASCVPPSLVPESSLTGPPSVVPVPESTVPGPPSVVPIPESLPVPA